MFETLVPLQSALEESREHQQLRSLQNVAKSSGSRITIDGNELINFASNDYLGLSRHPHLKKRASLYANRYGVGSASSRLLSGNVEIYEGIERTIAALKCTETALVFSTGFQANATIIEALGRNGAVLASDRFNHSSIMHGLQLSGSRWFRYRHRDYVDLEERLRQRTGETTPTKWIITESIFSMDGDEADHEALKQTAVKCGANLYVDEAHSIGLRGPKGFGLQASTGCADVFLGTFGKSFGSFGAYLACPSVVRDYLVNYCPGLIYSTALPPPVLGAIEAALEIVPTLSASRKELIEKADYLRQGLHMIGFDTLGSTSQIIPILVSSNEQALALGAFLRGNGFFAPAIRPPTVAEGTSRIRLSLTANHSMQEIDSLLLTLARYQERRS